MGVHGRPITWDVSVGNCCFLISSDYCSTGLGADLREVLVRLGCRRLRRHLGPLDRLKMELHIGCMVIANCAGTAQSGPGEYCREREYPFYLLSDRILSSWSLALVTVVGRGIFGTGCLIPNRTLCRGLSRTRDHCGRIRRRINRAAPHWFSSSLAPLPPDASSSSSFCSSSVPGLLGETDRRSFVHPSQPD